VAAYDQEFWEQLWERTLRERAGGGPLRPPNENFIGAASGLEPGRALDAGCGHGAETLWLAARGWRVTAVDFSAAALAHARSTAEAAGAEIAERVDWVQADLGAWIPEPQAYDLVISLYVHVAGSVVDMVQRLAGGVAEGGALVLVGHPAVDSATGMPTRAAGQQQVSVGAATAGLDPRVWDLITAEERPRSASDTGVDAVIHAVRRSPLP
jgi:SAM-dependent methyltransferase